MYNPEETIRLAVVSKAGSICSMTLKKSCFSRNNSALADFTPVADEVYLSTTMKVVLWFTIPFLCAKGSLLSMQLVRGARGQPRNQLFVALERANAQADWAPMLCAVFLLCRDRAMQRPQLVYQTLNQSHGIVSNVNRQEANEKIQLFMFNRRQRGCAATLTRYRPNGGGRWIGDQVSQTGILVYSGFGHWLLLPLRASCLFRHSIGRHRGNGLCYCVNGITKRLLTHTKRLAVLLGAEFYLQFVFLYFIKPYTYRATYPAVQPLAKRYPYGVLPLPVWHETPSLCPPPRGKSVRQALSYHEDLLMLGNVLPRAPPPPTHTHITHPRTHRPPSTHTVPPLPGPKQRKRRLMRWCRARLQLRSLWECVRDVSPF